MKQIKKIMFISLTLALVLSLVGCGTRGRTGEYTLHEYMEASPLNWSSHAWEKSNDSYIPGYTEMGFIDIIMNEAGNGYEWAYEMATSVTDVTATYEENEKYGIDPKEEGRVWEIKLNRDAVWADGKKTAINADTYIYSMQQLLDPEMQNYRANNYCVGDAALYNAENYYYHGAEKKANVVYDWDDDGQILDNKFTEGTSEVIFNSADTCQFFGDTFKKYYDAYKLGDSIEGLSTYIDGKDHIVDAELAALLTLAAKSFGDNNPTAYYEFCSFMRPMDIVEWSEVGLIKKDEYTLYYITAAEISEFYFYIAMSSNWIVYKDLYEKGKKEVNDLIATTYGTSLKTYMSFGPYKLSAYQKDKQMTFVKNDDWYGWSDGKHVGQYQTTKIVCDIISDHNTQLLKFNKGELDSVSLSASDMEKYRFSDNLLKTDETYTMRFIFNTDKTALKALEGSSGKNKVILSYYDFRKAFSLSINREQFATEGTAGHKAAFGLLNTLYYYNVEKDAESIYRYTDEAKLAILKVYGLDQSFGEGKTYPTMDAALEALTGYNITEAKALFQKAYTDAIAAGDYTAGQEIEIQVAASASALTEEDNTQCRLLQTYLNAATEGTGFQGKITITFTGSHTNRYTAVANGQVEMARGAWGGAAYYPFSAIRCYTDPDYADIHEAGGFDATKETVTMTYKFDGETEETITATYQWWAKSLNSKGTYNLAPLDVKLHILSCLEYELINGYHFIVVTSYADVSMYSYKIQYATTTYNIMYAYGGVRFMTYKYDDREWYNFVKENKNQLSYE